MQSEKRHKLLSAKDINFTYGERTVLSKINFSLNDGEVVGVIGESGSGKTTLLKVLAAKLAPASGEVFFKEENVYQAQNQLLRGHDKIKIVDQDFDLMPYVTVDENIIRNSLSLSDNGRKRLLGKLKNALNLKDVGKNKAVNTSGGQKQRVALATAVATTPDVLILDEPFANLDYALKMDVIRLLKADWRAKAMVVVAHEPSDLLSLCNRIVVMKKGKIIQRGSTEEVYENPKNLYVAKLLGPVNELSKSLAGALEIPNQKWLRPHQISIGKMGVAAEVCNTHFCGNYTEVQLALPDFDDKLVVHQAIGKSYSIGQKVKIKADL